MERGRLVERSVRQAREEALGVARTSGDEPGIGRRGDRGGGRDRRRASAGARTPPSDRGATSARALFTRTSAGAVRTAASKASRSASSKRSAARAGASGKTAASATRRWRPASPPKTRASASARAMKARGREGGGSGRARRAPRTECALFGARGETRGHPERDAREGLAGLFRREREERAHARRLRGEPGREGDPRGQAGEPERRRVEARDERRGGAVFPRESGRRGAQPLAHGLRLPCGLRHVGRGRPGGAPEGERAREEENPESQRLSSPSRALRPARRRGCARARRGRSRVLSDVGGRALVVNLSASSRCRP